MTWDQVEGAWKQLKGRVGAKWGKITDSELDTIAGKRERLAGKLQEKYGFAREQAERRISEFAKSLDRTCR